MSTLTSLHQRRKRDQSNSWLDHAAILALVAALLLIVAALMLIRYTPTRPESAVPVIALGEEMSYVVSADVVMPIDTATDMASSTAKLSATPQVKVMQIPPVMSTSTLVPEGSSEAVTVAIIAGHRNSDSGAICELEPYKGLQEVEVTTAVTAQLVALLTEAGITVLDLDEFDSRINGLVADAFISIHADSCVNWEGTSGYKAARAYNSVIPEVEDRFVACIDKEYGAATGLSIHPGSITPQMTSYHAFHKVDVYTPAIIMEIGFLYYDHDLLTKQPQLVAEGLKRGIECFLNGDEIADVQQAQ